MCRLCVTLPRIYAGSRAAMHETRKFQLITRRHSRTGKVSCVRTSHCCKLLQHSFCSTSHCRELLVGATTGVLMDNVPSIMPCDARGCPSCQVKGRRGLFLPQGRRYKATRFWPPESPETMRQISLEHSTYTFIYYNLLPKSDPHSNNCRRPSLPPRPSSSSSRTCWTACPSPTRPTLTTCPKA